MFQGLELNLPGREAASPDQVELLNQMHDAIIVRDMDAAVRFWSEGAQTLYGWREAEALGQNSFALLGTQFSEPRERIEALLHETGRWEGELVHTARDGRQLTVASRWFLQSDDMGTPLAVIEFNRDVSEGRHAQNALRNSEARFQAIFEHAGVGMALVDLTERTLHTNAALQEMLGYSAQELLEVSFAELTHPNDVTRGRTLAAELAAGQRDFYRIEKRYVHKTGRLVWGSITVTLVRDVSGRPAFSVRMVEDITERKQTQRILAQQSERLKILHEIDQAILAAHSSADIAGVAVHRLRQVIPCSAAGVALYDESGQDWQPLALDTGDVPATAEALAVPPATDPAAALRAGEVLTLEDLAAAAGLPPAEEMLSRETVRACVVIPLLAGEQLIGALALGMLDRDDLGAEHVDLAQQVAGSLAVAIHHARLYEQLQASQAQLRSLSRRLVEVQENERAALARNLHDEAGQSLTSLKIGLSLLRQTCAAIPEAVEQVAGLTQTTDDVMEGLHRLAVDLRPASLDRAGLEAAVAQYINSYRLKDGLVIEFLADGLANQRLPSEVETCLYRAVQESLTNVVRHSGASRAGVLLKRSGHQVMAIVEDNGQGFEADVAAASGRLGLVGMRERVELLGGTLTIESTPGAGTTVYITLPLADA